MLTSLPFLMSRDFWWIVSHICVIMLLGCQLAEVPCWHAGSWCWRSPGKLRKPGMLEFYVMLSVSSYLQQIKLMNFMVCVVTASRWSYDDAYCWTWNNCCCSDMVCFFVSPGTQMLHRILQVIKFLLEYVWSYCGVMQSSTKMRKAQAEVDSVLSNGAITVESLKKLEYVTCTIILNSTSIDSYFPFLEG